MGGFGKHREIDAQDSIGAHLEQHAREDDRNRGRRFDVRIRQPGVKRKRGNLDRKADEQRDPYDALEGR
jgi:hypothetical protein